MKRVLLAFSVATILTGCATQQAANQIQADCGAPDGSVSAACASKHPSLSKMPSQYQRAIAHRNVVNELVAANKLTKTQADFLQEEYQAKMQNEIAAQEAAAAVASAPARNAMATTGAALILAGQPRPAQPVNPVNRMRTTNCNAFGNSVNCTSF